ncbi:MAG TPA: 3D domain-containing protein [Bryobacteraceae bacterium]|nr:3D domain-containing protein [Bryobacteraceae bacterium]
MRLAVTFALTGMLLTCMGQVAKQSANDVPHRAKTVRPRTKPHPLLKFVATAESVSGITAKGTRTHEGIVAADPDVLPLGSLIRVTGAGTYSGIYTVTDTGPKVQGRHIDICMDDEHEARVFGRQTVYVRVILRGNNEKNHKEITPAEPMLPAHEAAAGASQ